MNALDDLVEKHNAEHRTIGRANWTLHEDRLERCAALLECPVQTLMDVLYQVSIETNRHPDDILFCACELIRSVKERNVK